MSENQNVDQNQKSSEIKFFLQIEALSLVLGIFYHYLFYQKTIGISFLVLVVSVLVVGYVFAKKHQVAIPRCVPFLALLLLFFATMIFIRSSALLTVLNMTISVYLMMMIMFSFVKTKITEYDIKDYLLVLKIPVNLCQIISVVIPISSKMFAGFKNYKTFPHIVRGILITLPVLILFLFLLSSADMVFQEYCSKIFNFVFDPEIILRIAHVFIPTLTFIAAFFYTFQNQDNQYSDQLDVVKKSGNKIEVAILFGSINVLFFLFILVQFKYLFFGGNDASVQGFTYAEYARSGFFQLITVAVISFFLIRNFDKKSFSSAVGEIDILRIMGGILVLQVLIIMISAFERLALYESMYGFTELRLYSHAFTVLLAVSFILLLYKLLVDNREDRFAFGVFISCIVTMIAMNIMNPELFIARKNTKRFLASGKIDIDYLTNLSDDAIPELVRVMNLTTDQNVKRSFANSLHSRQGYFEFGNAVNGGNWQSMKMSQIKAKKILNRHRDDIQKADHY